MSARAPTVTCCGADGELEEEAIASAQKPVLSLFAIGRKSGMTREVTVWMSLKAEFGSNLHGAISGAPNCMKISCIRAGKYKGAITDSPDYEFQAFLGPNLGVFMPEENVYLSSLIEDLGMCGIQTGSVWVLRLSCSNEVS